ncbi:MAG: TadE family protein [Candidatus Limnocylindria bacterium]
MILKRRHRREGRGQAMVELALALPIFFLILFGLIDLGRAVFVYSSLSEGAREGARYGSVQARAFNTATRDTVEAYVVDLLDGVPNPTVDASCTPQGAFGCTVDDILIVQAEADVSMITPIIGQIVGTLHIEARSEAVVNN